MRQANVLDELGEVVRRKGGEGDEADRLGTDGDESRRRRGLSLEFEVVRIERGPFATATRKRGGC